MAVTLGLTGSIGTGKSTTCELFEEHGAMIWSADAAVHRLYAPGGKAVPAIAELAPAAIVEDYVSRPLLARGLRTDPSLLPRLEAIVHPLVAEDRAEAIKMAVSWLLVLEIPLLFEKTLKHDLDATACTWVDPDTQKTRVLERPGMTEEQFEFILKHHWPQEKKRAAADYEINTSSPETARSDVGRIVEALKP